MSNPAPRMLGQPVVQAGAAEEVLDHVPLAAVVAPPALVSFVAFTPRLITTLAPETGRPPSEAAPRTVYLPFFFDAFSESDGEPTSARASNVPAGFTVPRPGL